MNNDIINLADTIEGEINRMCVTTDMNELCTMYDYAKKNLLELLFMIYDTKFKKKVGVDNVLISDIQQNNHN